VLAVAEPDFLFLGQGEFFRTEAAALVGAVTEGLVAAESAGTPPVITGFKFEGAGLSVVNLGKRVHGREYKRGC
jgi:hypothetical protein